MRALLFSLLGLAAVWMWREPALNQLGWLLVEETPLAPADLVVIFSDNEVSAAAAAADIVRKGYAPRVLLFEAPAAPSEVVLDRLHIAVPRRHEFAVIVMRRMGIAASDIVVDPLTDPGTNNAALATARYARSHGVRRVIVLTYRSHSRRTAVLLRNALGRSSEIIVRPAPDDPFHPEGWWRDRSTCREAMMEGIRWMNSVLFGDLLSRERFQSGI